MQILSTQRWPEVCEYMQRQLRSESLKILPIKMCRCAEDLHFLLNIVLMQTNFLLLGYCRVVLITGLGIESGSSLFCGWGAGAGAGAGAP